MAGRKINPWLKAGLEFGPILAFFIAFGRLKERTFTLGGTEYSGFILATAVFVPLLVATTLVLWRLTGRLSAMQIATLVLVVVFGGLTIWLNDPRFLKMKVTLIYLLFAGLLTLGMVLGKSWLALVMDEVLPLTAQGWRILTWRLIGFFLGLAVLNEVIWRTMSDQAWVNFKTFGLSALVFGFFMAQTRLFARHAPPKDD